MVGSYEKMIVLSHLYERLVPSHNEPAVDKQILCEVLEALRQIGAGRYTEDLEAKIRRYDYRRFSIVIE